MVRLIKALDHRNAKEKEIADLATGLHRSCSLLIKMLDSAYEDRGVKAENLSFTPPTPAVDKGKEKAV